MSLTSDPWDAAFSAHSDRVLSEDPDPWLLRHARCLSGARRLFDAGCGAGRHVTLLGQLAPELWLVDRSTSALELAATRVARDCSVTYLQADMTAWRPAETFDGGVCTDVLSTVTDPLNLMLSLAAALRPGAPLLLTCNALDDPMFSAPCVMAEPSGFVFTGYCADRVEALSADSGFDVVRCERYVHREGPHSHRPFPHEHVLVGAVLRRAGEADARRRRLGRYAGSRDVSGSDRYSTPVAKHACSHVMFPR
jgi:SAM-dependent methyltransferase